MRRTGFYLGATIVDDVQNEHDRRPRGGLRPGAERHAHGRSGRRHRAGEQVRLRQRRLDLHQHRQAPRASSSIASRPAWSAINVGVPATMAMFPFTGWDDSFFGDLHIQGKEGVQFYTQQKVVSIPLVRRRRRRRLEEMMGHAQVAVTIAGTWRVILGERTRLAWWRRRLAFANFSRAIVLNDDGKDFFGASPKPARGSRALPRDARRALCYTPSDLR